LSSCPKSPKPPRGNYNDSSYASPKKSKPKVDFLRSALRPQRRLESHAARRSEGRYSSLDATQEGLYDGGKTRVKSDT
jgi:hypothetical protein